jgi:hypothetical protein
MDPSIDDLTIVLVLPISIVDAIGEAGKRRTRRHEWSGIPSFGPQDQFPGATQWWVPHECIICPCVADPITQVLNLRLPISFLRSVIIRRLVVLKANLFLKQLQFPTSRCTIVIPILI